MNFVFMSPNFPISYRHFCTALKANGVNVLGVGDAPFEELHPDLQQALTEYYKVDSLADYDQLIRAIGYFTGRYGKMDWIESNNEFWLETDAALRTDFNITSGLKTPDMDKIKRKSVMKEYYRKAGLPVARAEFATTPEAAFAFTAKVGYPVVAKPDNGVGATATYKFTCDEDVIGFFAQEHHTTYLLEEFVPGFVTTYDGIINSKGEVLFAASHISPGSIMDMVNDHIPMYYYVDKDMPQDVIDAGKATLAAFGVRRRFFHLEFFRLYEDKEGLGKKGDLVALEVNMRPAGGYTTDMINFSQSADVFQIWADMVAFDELRHSYEGKHTYCVFSSRWDDCTYKRTVADVKDGLGDKLRIASRIPDAISGAMANDALIACFDTLEEMNDFVFTHLEQA